MSLRARTSSRSRRGPRTSLASSPRAADITTTTCSALTSRPPRSPAASASGSTACRAPVPSLPWSCTGGSGEGEAGSGASRPLRRIHPREGVLGRAPRRAVVAGQPQAAAAPRPVGLDSPLIAPHPAAPPRALVAGHAQPCGLRGLVALPTDFRFHTTSRRSGHSSSSSSRVFSPTSQPNRIL